MLGPARLARTPAASAGLMYLTMRSSATATPAATGSFVVSMFMLMICLDADGKIFEREFLHI